MAWEVFPSPPPAGLGSLTLWTALEESFNNFLLICMIPSSLGPIRGVGHGIWERFEPNPLDFFFPVLRLMVFQCEKRLCSWCSCPFNSSQRDLAGSGKLCHSKKIPAIPKDTGHPDRVWTSWQDYIILGNSDPKQSFWWLKWVEIKTMF